jgi:DNA polymerase-1
MHIFENHGIRIGGFVHDNKHTSRFWYSSKDVKHDLKSQASGILGASTSGYAELFSRPATLKGKSYKKTTLNSKGPRKGPLAGVPTLTCEGNVSTFSSRKRVLIPLDQVAVGGLYEPLLPTLYAYAAADAKYSLELAPYREAQLAARPAKGRTTLELYKAVWNPALLMLNRMEHQGITVDRATCDGIRDSAQEDMDDLLPQIRQFAGSSEFNPGSADQLRTLVYDTLGLPRSPIKGTMFAIGRAKPDEYSTSEVSLHWLQLHCPEHNAGLDLIRRWRKIRRNMQFGRDLPKYIGHDGRVHTIMSPEADTGRLSCKMPALQQIPSKNDTYGLRGAFISRPGYRLVVADFSQLEVYVLAHILIRLFGDTSVYDALRSGDVYTWIARECWPEKVVGYTNADFKTKGHPANKLRDLAKILVLATNYGKTAAGLALSLLDEFGEPATELFCNELLATYMSTLPGLARWQEWTARFARDNGGVYTMLGRWRPLPLARSGYRGEASRGARQALNSPIQGSAMDIAVLVMLQLNGYEDIHGWFHREMHELGALCLLQVHDELIFEVPEANADVALQLIEHGMTNPPILDLAVKLRVEAKAARSWKDAK